MTLFSARGPVGGFIKPDVTAPGLQVLAGAAPEPADPAAGPPGQLFQSIAGTSMSSPYAAGVAALVRASHPRWSAGQVKSALMTSALQTVTKEDGITSADPFDGGAGSIRADRAVRPTLTFDVPAADYVAATDPLGWVDLNLPSIDAIGIRGELSTTRYGRNVSGSAQTFSASATAPVGATITVTSPDWRVEPGGTLEIDVRIDGERSGGRPVLRRHHARPGIDGPRDLPPGGVHDDVRLRCGRTRAITWPDRWPSRPGLSAW